MKTTILSLATAIILTACGGKTETKTTENITTDTTKVAEQKPEVPKEEVSTKRDYNFYLTRAKTLQLDGIKLEHFNTYNDSTGMSYSVIFKNRDKSLGFDEIALSCGPVKLYIGDDRKTYENFTLEGFNKQMNKNRDKKIKEYKGQEYTAGDKKFFYCYLMDQPSSFGTPKHHTATSQCVMDGFLIGTSVIVHDTKSDMKKAEEVIKKVADIFAR